MLLLPYTPVSELTFPQTNRGFPVFSDRGDYEGTQAECRHCRGYGTVYGDQLDLVSGACTPGYVTCHACNGHMWAPFTFKVIKD